MLLANAKGKLAIMLGRIVNYDSYILQATIIAIVIYNRNTFIVQAIADGVEKLFFG
jgi:hypothetical protein